MPIALFCAMFWICASGGQTSAEILRFVADLNGANVRPAPTASSATGSMVMLYDTTTDLFDIEIQLFGMEGEYYPAGDLPDGDLSVPSSTHIHEGGPDVTSVFHLYDTLPGNWVNSLGTNAPMAGDWTYTATDQQLVLGGVDDLINIGGYLNVHSYLPSSDPSYRGGEIRGQIVLAANGAPEPTSVVLIFAAISGMLIAPTRRRRRCSGSPSH